MDPLTVALIFVVIPVVALAALAGGTMFRSSGRGTRWRTGDEWDHEPLWWMGNPRGSGVSEPVVEAVPSDGAGPRTARGGARGTW